MANWTIVVWAAITHDLREPFQADLKEVALALATRESAAGPGTADVQLHVAWTPITATKDLDLPEPIKRLGQVGDGESLREALLEPDTCWDTDPDRKRLLVLWGHGARGLPGQTKPFIVPAADEVITAFSGPADTTPPAPHIIGYDACRMASATTVMTLARVLDKSVFIGSMIPEPVSGWPYTELLRILCDNSDPKAAAAAIVQAYAASVDVPDWCLAAFDLAKIGDASGPLAKALKAVNAAALPGASDFYSAASGADTLDDTDLVDLGALMRRLTDRPVTTTSSSKAVADAKALVAAADGVRLAIREATVMRRASGNLAGRDGLSVLVKVPGQKPVPVPAPPPAGKTGNSGKSGGSSSSTPPRWGKYLEDGIFV
jgi:hypothetical protein